MHLVAGQKMATFSLFIGIPSTTNKGWLISKLMERIPRNKILEEPPRLLEPVMLTPATCADLELMKLASLQPTSPPLTFCVL